MEYQKRKKEIELFFNEILKDAKTPAINGFYYKVVENLIIGKLKAQMTYNGLGFNFKVSDKEILNEIVKEHYAKMEVIKGIKC